VIHSSTFTATKELRAGHAKSGEVLYFARESKI